MPELRRRQILVLLLAAGFVLTLVGCGGGSGSGADDESEAVSTGEDETSDTAAATTEEIDTSESSSTGTEPALPAGRGTLVLDDGRSFTITVTECQFNPDDGTPTAGTVEVKGTSERGSTFELTQFFLNGEWSQSDASIAFPNRDQIYVLVSSASSDGEPATVEGKTIRWTRTFKELDESANAHVYTGEGTLLLTCP